MQNKPARVSVVICAYTMKRLEDTQKAVESAMNQTLKPVEIIVSVDSNEELAQSLKVKLPPETKVVLNQATQGVSATRSLGISLATGDVVACMDDDAIAEKDWLETLVRPVLSSNVAIIGGRCILSWQGGKRPLWFAEELDWIVGGTYKGMPVNGRDIRNVSSCNMAGYKSTYEKVGFFSGDIGAVGGKRRGGEEAEFCLKVAKAFPDKTIIYEPNAVVHHKVHVFRVTMNYLIRRSFDEGFSKALLQRSIKSGGILSTENSYLNYVLFTSIPQRLKEFYRKGRLLQAGAIIISIVSTGTGYLVGKAGRAKTTKKESAVVENGGT
jgi:glycosyltransferase involved in cell wall biosynthesis